ncbi:MAG TPA: hypothetical protein VF723_10825 [Pyrinomonadaceae bacterium]
MITGFNTDVNHDGVVYHVQTEDKGLDSPLILSLVYVGGAILASKRTPYQDLISAGFDETKLAERLHRQHKLICAAIHAGRIEDLKRQTERDSGARAARTNPPAASDAAAFEPPAQGVRPPAPVDTQPKPPPDAQRAAPPSLAEPPLAGSPPGESQRPVEATPQHPGEQPQAAEPGPRTTQVPVGEVLDHAVLVPAEATEIADELHLSLIEEKKLNAGEFVKLQVRIGRGAEGREPVPNATVTLKVLGTSFRPLIFSVKTTKDGIATFYTMLPYFTTGRAAILLSVSEDGHKYELRRMVHQA